MAHLLCGKVVIFGSLDPIVVLDCKIIYIYIYILLKILLITEHNGDVSPENLPDYTALHGRRPHTFIFLPYCHELTQKHYSVSQVASQTVPRDGRPLFQSAVSRGPRISVQCAAGKTVFSVTILKSKCKRRLAPASRHVSRLPNTL
jgi:hypothetical protein